MKVQEIMTADVAACRPNSNLAEVTSVMFHRDCGFLPVIGADGHLAGVITDRDIAIAVATKDRPADRIEVAEVLTGQVFTCSPQETVNAALDTMRVRKVRRLPVVDDAGHLKGILSLNDIVRQAGGIREGVSADEVLAAMKNICAHDEIVVTGAA